MTNLILRNRHSPFAGLPTLVPNDMWEEFHKIFTDMLGPSQDFPNLKIQKGFPKGDVYLDEGNMVVALMLAGYKREQLSVEVKNDRLVVSAQKNESTDENKSKQIRRSAFTKEFLNSADKWDLMKSEASYEDGLLKIVIPPKEPDKPQSVKLTIK